MKSSTMNDDNTERQRSLRQFIISGVKITLLGALIFIVVWLALELFFPRVTRAEDTESHATQSASEEKAYPLATAKVLMDKADWGAVKWTVHPVLDKPGAEDCATQAAASAAMAMKGSGIDFKFVYGKPVEFYQETVPVKIARILDVLRAPEAAKDQLGMKLYDVDALSALGYKKLLEEFAAMGETADPDAQGVKARFADQPIMAFVAALNTGPWTDLSGWHEGAWAARKIDFIGAPVQWNADVLALLRYEAGESDLYKTVSECAQYSNTKLIKRAMYDVITSAEGIDEEGTPEAQRAAESEVAKMYLGVMSKHFDLENDIKGVNPIRTVSFRSAWDGALTHR